MVVKNVLHYAAIVQIFALYVQDYAQETLNIQKIYVLYALKFVKLVLKNVLSMHLIMKLVKPVQKLVKSVQKLAHNKQLKRERLVSLFN
jgi:nitrogen fixation/metabolism regulation signal transduction histidine kinase